MEPTEFTLYILMAIIMVVLLVATGHAASEYSNISEMTIGMFVGAGIVWGNQYLMSIFK